MTASNKFIRPLVEQNESISHAYRFLTFLKNSRYKSHEKSVITFFALKNTRWGEMTLAYKICPLRSKKNPFYL